MLRGFATGTVLETGAGSKAKVDAGATPQVTDEAGKNVTNEVIPSTSAETSDEH